MIPFTTDLPTLVTLAGAAVRFDGRRVVDHDINGVPILEGRALPLPRYDRPTLDEIRIEFEKRANAAKVAK